MPCASFFQRARVLMKTGERSFAVQLAVDKEGLKFLPGIIEIHCTKVDWGNHAMLLPPGKKGAVEGSCCPGMADMKEQQLFWKRLENMGSAAMFVSSPVKEEHGLYSATCGGAMELHEGVEVKLGHYAPGMHAFMRCELRVRI